ncbi:hypothetical protein D3C78_1221360 [compost metagenome]
MLADVAQELQRAHAAKPVVVVGHDRGVVAFKAQERRHLAADLVHPAGDHVRGVQLALGGLEARVADHAGGAADEGDRAVAGLLEAAQYQHRYQVAEVEAVGGRVEAAIQGHTFLSQQFVECRRVGLLGDQAASLQFLDKAGLVHVFLLHMSRTRAVGRALTIAPVGVATKDGDFNRK